MENNPFNNLGLPPNLVPNPPSEMPEAPGAGNADIFATEIPDAQDYDAIAAGIVHGRQLRLLIPNRDKRPDLEFRVINNLPHEIVEAERKGWRLHTGEDQAQYFQNVHAGTDKTGKAYNALLMSRAKGLGDAIRKHQRKHLQSVYAGMDPRNREFSGKYSENAGREGGSRGVFSGPTFSIKV